MKLPVISPEGLEIAQSYLRLNSIALVASELGISEHEVSSYITKPEVKRYIDNVYLDIGYRNKHNIGNVMDEIIRSKLEEAAESGIYSSKDLADLLAMAHKMRMDEIKAETESRKYDQMKVRTQNNLQINGDGNLGSLVSKLLEGEKT